MNPSLNIFDTTEDTARAVAELILAKAKEKNKLSLPFNIAISGGSTPKLLFTLLASEYVDSIPWHFVRLFWVDERCVSPTNAESNFGMTYQTLLKHVPIHEANIFRMQGESEPQTEVNRYQALLEKELAMLNGYPQLDLVLLGMGDDGHTASIFPNDMSLLDTELAVGIGVHPISGQKRITLTGPTIFHAKQVVFLITGESKSGVLRQIIQNEPKSELYPASHIHSIAGEVDYYLDIQAAKELTISK
ncbi:MAG TPA: 6-phosphogluconolactonase [Paludibacter sp.]